MSWQATAALVFGIPNGLLIIHSLVRWFRPYRDTPCPGERDAHDALRDGGEGLGAFHSRSTKTIWEQDHA